MGAFLDKPVVVKTTTKHSGNGLTAGESSCQGWRIEMEDHHTIQFGIGNEPTYSFFGVFDGHGGKDASRIASEKLVDSIVNTAEWKSGDRSIENLKKALRSGFLAFDKDMRTSPAFSDGHNTSGTTAVTCLITPTDVICANAGDSRAIFVSDNQAYALSEDHKPKNPIESSRIIASGGHVYSDRVNGDLAVSRAFGDYSYKSNRNLEDTAQAVSPEPDFIVYPRDEKSQYVVLCCDGVWDVMSNDDVAEFLFSTVASGCDDPSILAEEVIDNALAHDSKDNLSVIVVALPGAPVAPEQNRASFTAARATRIKELHMALLTR